MYEAMYKKEATHDQPGPIGSDIDDVAEIQSYLISGRKNMHGRQKM
jgi:hypothetical protein